MDASAVHDTLTRTARRLEQLGIPYAVVGGMALGAHGYSRATVDVDILVTRESLTRIHQELDGRGYLPPFTGSKHLRDTVTGVKVEFLVAGGFPGDGKPKPVSFPDPADPGVAVEVRGVRYVSMPKLIELKLACALTAPDRIKDFGDVQELIKAVNLPRDLAEALDPFVRAKYQELWDGANTRRGESEEP